MNMNETHNKRALNNIVQEFFSYTSRYIPTEIAKKLSKISKETFSFYMSEYVEETILVLKNRNNKWEASYKVCPSYLDDDQNLSKIDYLNRDTVFIISLRDFYYNFLRDHSI